MALWLLDIEVLENIAERVNIDDKSNLLMTGHGTLLSKLSCIKTDVSTLPMIKSWARRDPNDFNAFVSKRGRSRIRIVRKSFEDMMTSAHHVGKIARPKYNLVPLRFTAARHADLYVIDPDFLRQLPKLESLHVYLRPGWDWDKFLPALPSTLTKLSITDFDNYNIFAVLDCVHPTLPPTLLSLKMRTVFGNGYPVGFPTKANFLTKDHVAMLPRSLEILDGIGFYNNKAVAALPRSITKLKVRCIMAVESLPPGLTRLTQVEVMKETAHLEHSHVQKLSCYYTPSSDIENLCKLRMVTVLHLTIEDYDFNNPQPRARWNVPYLEFPPLLTRLRLSGSSKLCCIIPASVQSCENTMKYYNIFDTRTQTWICSGPAPTYTPNDVVHAKLNLARIDYTNRVDLIQVLIKLKDRVETLEIKSIHCITYRDELIVFNFESFKKCKKLVLPQPVQADGLPPSLTYMEIEHLEECIVFPETLQYVDTWYKMTPEQVRTISPSCLKCVADNILQDTSCVSHIQQVVLRVGGRKTAHLPVLPNVVYEAYEMPLADLM